MDYVKSYDELTMLYAMKKNLANGSAGGFGTYLLTLKPTPKQVIFSTFGPTQRQPSSGAEAECLLYGDIKITDVVIRDPLTQDNFEEVIFKGFPDILSSSFIDHWLSHHKQSISRNFAIKCLTKIKSLDDVYTVLSNSNTSPYFLSKISYSDLVTNAHFKKTFDNYIVITNGSLFVEIPNHSKISIPNRSDLNIKLRELLKDSLVQNSKEELDKLSSQKYMCKLYATDENEKYSTFLLIDENGYAILRHLVYLKKNNEKVSHPIIDDLNSINKELEKMMSELIIGKSLYDYTDEKRLDFIYGLFRSAQEINSKFGSLIKQKKDYWKKGFQWFYHSFARGQIKNRDTFSLYTKLMRKVLTIDSF